tara:strand:+ start:186 stop:689 length:504 start_codon:yes stop_codon:yes gene_type:complete
MKYWCVAKSRINAEDQAAFHLTRQDFKVLLPKHMKRRAHARRVEWVPRPLFPGYLFVEIDLECSLWRAIRSTIGIFDVICFGEKPAAVPEVVIEEIRARQNEAGLVKVYEGEAFRRGEHVRVLQGALGDLDALFESTDGSNRVTVLLNMLGRQVRAQVNENTVFAAL